MMETLGHGLGFMWRAAMLSMRVFWYGMGALALYLILNAAEVI